MAAKTPSARHLILFSGIWRGSLFEDQAPSLYFTRLDLNPTFLRKELVFDSPTRYIFFAGMSLPP